VLAVTSGGNLRICVIPRSTRTPPRRKRGSCTRRPTSCSARRPIHVRQVSSGMQRRGGAGAVGRVGAVGRRGGPGGDGCPRGGAAPVPAGAGPGGHAAGRVLQVGGAGRPGRGGGAGGRAGGEALAGGAGPAAGDGVRRVPPPAVRVR